MSERMVAPALFARAKCRSRSPTETSTPSMMYGTADHLTRGGAILPMSLRALIVRARRREHDEPVSSCHLAVRQPAVRPNHSR